jgi:uncharacterized protein DUF4255
MSTYAAIGAVGLSLQRLLSDRLDQPAGTVVTVGNPPDEPNAEDPVVNLFLYRVSLNGALSNMPPRNRGERGAYGHPPLPLNLYYLLNTYGTTTATGSDTLQDEIVAHDLLGSAMRVLNDYPILTPQIETGGGVQVLDADLLDADEAVKITLDPLSLEDLSKVWTALSRPFRPSAAYEVSLVQIDSKLRTPNVQPVGPIGLTSGPKVHVTAGMSPTIDDLHGAQRTAAQIRAGETLVLEGSGFAGDETLASIDGLDDVAQVTSVQDDRMTVLVLDDPRLQPGIHTLRVSHGMMIGEPLQRRATFVSNTVAFALVPRVDSATTGSGKVTIKGDRLLHPDVECLTLVGGQTVTAYDVSSTPVQLKMTLPPELEPTVAVRVFVRVNGVQSIDQVTVTP